MEEENQVQNEVKVETKTFSADYVTDLRNESKERNLKIKELSGTLTAAQQEKAALEAKLAEYETKLSEIEQEKKDSGLKAQLVDKTIDPDAALILLKAGDWLDDKGSVKDAFFEKYPALSKTTETKKVGNDASGGKSSLGIKSVDDLKGMTKEFINQNFEKLKESTKQ